MPEPTTKDTTYLSERLSILRITEAQNTFTRTWKETVSFKDDATGEIRTKVSDNKRDYQLFDADETGNIVIRYFNLLGQPFRWKKESTKMPRDYVRLRLRNPKGSMKYASPAGSPVFPYFPPEIIAKFTAGEQIHTLHLIEGEFKAFKACKVGIDAVGLPGIYGFYNGDLKGKLNEDIQDLILKCKVKKLVLLMDADVLSVNWADKKDLAARPMGFYGSIKSFRESLQLLIDDQEVALELVYWMHIQIKYMNDSKGLDDLLVNYEDRTVEIQEDIAQLQLARKYFAGFIINDLSRDIQGKIFRYLGLADEKEFYKTYQDFIGAREFMFKRRAYVYDQEKKEVVFVRHKDADKFMRIGPDWVKVITTKNKFGEEEEDIVPWKITEILRDYKYFPGFIDQVQKYDAFCNEPAWNGSYKRVHAGCYNLCDPLRWDPKEGPIATTVKFLKHIFQGSGNIITDDAGKFVSEESALGDTFTVAMDYLTILLRHPKQMLPVPILVSPENNTGKSTFLKWLQLLFGSNMCILGNDQFKMKFNGHYITKFIISIDEGFLEVDKKAEKERLKQLVTADTAYLEHKGMNVKKINYYGKLIICSNDADRVMKIDEGENRWFVVRVPVITEKDPDMEAKLKEEMEHFLFSLHHRDIVHPRRDRLWFLQEWFETEQFRTIVETTKNRVDRVFEEWIREQFLLFKLPVLRYSLKRLTEIFNDQKTSKYKIDSVEIKAYLEKKGLRASPPQRVKVPTGFDLPEEHSSFQPKILFTTAIERPYEFVAEDWLTPAQLEEYRKPLFDSDGQLVTKSVTKSVTPPGENPGQMGGLPF